MAGKVWFAVKRATKDADSAALLFVEKTAGLTILNGAAYGTPSQGVIVLSALGKGTVTITVDKNATALAHGWPGNSVWALKTRRIDGSTATLAAGVFTLSPAVVRAV